MTRKELINFGKQILQEWQDDHAARLAAALAFYMVFALPPILVLALMVAGQLYNTQMVQEQLLTQVGALVGSAGEQVVRAILNNVRQPQAVTLAAIASFFTLLFGASGAFLQVQDTLNTIWDVEPGQEQGIWETVKDRLFSFILVIAVGVLLFASMLLSTFLSAASQFLTNQIPQGHLLVQAGHVVISFSIISLLFALIFKYIPEVKIEWRDVWIGALVTAGLFSLGNWVISLYLARSAPGSAYGAAGSLIVILLWIYYSAQILFLGAEFTQVFANQYGSHLVPDKQVKSMNPQLPAGTARSGLKEQPALPKPELPTSQKLNVQTQPFWQPAGLQQLIRGFQRALVYWLAWFAAVARILAGKQSRS